jgi:hypothetical protein
LTIRKVHLKIRVGGVAVAFKPNKFRFVRLKGFDVAKWPSRNADPICGQIAVIALPWISCAGDPNQCVFWSFYSRQKDVDSSYTIVGRCYSFS